MESAEAYNDAQVNKLLPNIIWMCVCLFVGVIGNSLVLLVYRLRLKTEMNERYFIPILAFLDLLSSIFSSLNGLVAYFFYTNYPSEGLCKFLHFSSFLTSAASAHTLLLIAIQRYRKICIPFGKQMDLFWKRVSLAIVMILSLCYSFPVIFSAGYMFRKEENLTVRYCAIDAGEFPKFYQIYFIGIFLIVVLNIFAITVLYANMACSIYRRGRKSEQRSRGIFSKLFQKGAKNLERQTEPGSESSRSADGSNLSSQGNQVGPVTVGLKEYAGTVQSKSTEPRSGSEPQNDQHGSNCNTSKMTKSATDINQDNQMKKKEKNSKWNKTKVNFNRMFGAIVIFYIMSYIPTLVLFVGTSFDSLYDVGLNVFQLMNRMYIVNNIVNPFIYGYFDFCFRHSVKSLLTCRQ